MAVASIGGVLNVEEEASRAGWLKDEFSVQADSAIVIKGEALSTGAAEGYGGIVEGLITTGERLSAA